MINNFNRQRFNQQFRLAENQKVIINGFFNEPPDEVRYSNNPIRMLEVSRQSYPIMGKQIISSSPTKGRFLIGSFVTGHDCFIYRAYETNYQDDIIREVKGIHPVTKLEVKGSNLIIADQHFRIEYASQAPVPDINPVKFGTIYSTEPLFSRDVIGDFLVRNVTYENGLYIARVEYGSLTKQQVN